VSAIAERLSDPGMTALELASAPPSSVKADATLTLGLPPGSVPIELPPADVVPDSVRPPINRYAADASEATRAQLVAAVDQAGQRWEHTIASRRLEARAELVDACRRVVELHDELVSLKAAARWLRSFPRYLSWDLEPYGLLVGGEEVAVPEMLGATESAVSLWLAGKRPYPDQLPYALEQLLDADTAARIIRLIPPR
jgi:hypothetical protein